MGILFKMKKFTIKHLSLNGALHIEPLKIIPLEDSFEALMEMAADGTLTFENKPLVVDLFSRLSFNYEVIKNDKNELVLNGVIEGKEKIPLKDLAFIAPSHPVWFIHKGRLRVLKETFHYSDVRNLPKVISLKELKELEEDKSVEVHLNFVGEPVVPPLPVLKLRDPSGAFANLFIDKGDLKLKLYNPLENNLQEEVFWEKDLLEAGFQRKIMEKSFYFCPLPSVQKTLEFLLEMGWKIFDFKERQVFLQSGKNIFYEENGSSFEIKGELKFNETTKSITDAFQTLKRKEKWVDLSLTSVGLLKYDEELISLAESVEIIQEKATLKKESLGLLLNEISPSNSIDFLKISNGKAAKTLPPLESFSGTLRNYQQDGVLWLYNHFKMGFSAFLADDMGLGKTVQILAFLSLKSREERHLIIVPTSLLFNWENEINKFLMAPKIYRHHGALKQETLPTTGIILTTYHTLNQDLEIFKEQIFDTIILDEGNLIKNPHSQLAKAVFSLHGKFRIVMTGTAIENSVKELYSYFHFLLPSLFGSEVEFESEMALATEDHRFMRKIRKKIAPFFLRRKKEEVAKDLPPISYQEIYVEMDEIQKVEYQKFLASYKKGLIQKIKLEGGKPSRMEIFEALLRLRQIAIDPKLLSIEAPSCKMEALLLDLESIQKEGKKALIFSQFSSVLHLIGNELFKKNIPYCLLEGATIKREEEVFRFQNDETVPFFLISLKAGGVGLNLTAADYVLIFDPWWHVASENQAISRAHRIGQEKPVFVKRYITKGTIEEQMMALKEKKSALFAALIESQEEILSDISIREEDFVSLLLDDDL